MIDVSVTLEKREYGVWHIQEAQCSDDTEISETIEIQIDQINISQDEGHEYRLSVDGYITREMFCEECSEALTAENLSKESLNSETEPDLRAPVKLSNSVTSEFDLPDLGDIVGKPNNEGVIPIVTKSSEPYQQESAFIDRRPLITVDSKYKYADIELSVQPTGYLIKDKAISRIVDAIESARQYANSGLEAQKKEITATLLPGKEIETPAKDYARQRVLVQNIVIEAGYVLIEELVDVIKRSNILARYTSDFDKKADLPPVPRVGSPTPEPVDLLDGYARHVSLSDKQPPDVSEYASENAIHAANRFDNVSVSLCFEEHKVTWTDAERGNTAIVEFNEGEPVRYKCGCSSGIDPCEHVAALLQNLPPFSPIYIGTGWNFDFLELD